MGIETERVARAYEWQSVNASSCNLRHQTCEGGGFSTIEAQIQVKTFSSRKYKSHRRISDTVARAVDAI